MDIKKLRKEMRLSQIETAKALGISQAQFSNYENGHCEMDEVMKREFMTLYYSSFQKPKKEGSGKVFFSVGMVENEVLEDFKRLKGTLSNGEMFKRMVIVYGANVV